MKEVAPSRISQPGGLRTECDTPPRFWGGGGGRLEKCIALASEHWGFRSILKRAVTRGGSHFWLATVGCSSPHKVV